LRWKAVEIMMFKSLCGHDENNFGTKIHRKLYKSLDKFSQKLIGTMENIYEKHWD
jgi:hypothetical protein